MSVSLGLMTVERLMLQKQSVLLNARHSRLSHCELFLEEMASLKRGNYPKVQKKVRFFPKLDLLILDDINSITLQISVNQGTVRTFGENVWWLI